MHVWKGVCLCMFCSSVGYIDIVCQVDVGFEKKRGKIINKYVLFFACICFIILKVHVTDDLDFINHQWKQTILHTINT